MKKHTPEPWELWGDSIYSGVERRERGSIGGKRLKEVCQLNTDDSGDDELEVNEADAALIINAPQMLKALRSLVGGVDNVNGQTIVQPHDIAFAKAVIAAATSPVPR